MVRRLQGYDAKAVKDRLALGSGIMVRHYAKAALSGYIRISVGRPEHTDALVAALARIAEEGPAAGQQQPQGQQQQQQQQAVEA